MAGGEAEDRVVAGSNPALGTLKLILSLFCPNNLSLTGLLALKPLDTNAHQCSEKMIDSCVNLHVEGLNLKNEKSDLTPHLFRSSSLHSANSFEHQILNSKSLLSKKLRDLINLYFKAVEAYVEE